MLLARTFAGFGLLFALIAGVLFGAMGTLRDARAWWALADFFGCSALITVWLWICDKSLLERRTKAGPAAEADPVQKVVQSVAGLCFLGIFAVAGLERRLDSSQAPIGLSFIGDAVIAAGFLIVFLTFRENTFTAATIEIAEGQQVIDSGPYSTVRHPMYSGALVLIAGIPLALGSWWALAPAVMLAPVIIWRLLKEETFLRAHLDGYGDYCSRVRSRLAPMVW